MKTIVLLILALTASSVIGDACEQNFISRQFNIEILQTTLDDTTGFTKCKTITDAGKSCCSLDTVNGFEAKALEVIEELKESVSERDKFFIARRQDVVNVKGSLQKIRDAADKAMSNTSPTDFASLIVVGIAQGFGEMASAITDNWDTLKNNFTEFQSARSTCFNTLISTQAAAWCLACDPTAGTTGITQDTLTLHTELKSRVLADCYSYIEYSAGQSIVLSLYYMSSFLDGIATALEKISSGSASAMEDFMTVVSEMATIDQPTSVVELPVAVPDSCSKTECGWFFTSMFANGALNGENLAIGGKVSFNNAGRLLEAEDDDEVPIGAEGGRMLTGEWNPPEDEAGITVDFPTNPGGVDNESTQNTSAIRNGIVACVIASLALFF